MELSSVREDKEETYTHTPAVRTDNELLTGQNNRHEAPEPEAMAPTLVADAVSALQRQTDALSAKLVGHVRRGTSTNLADGIQPCSRAHQKMAITAFVEGLRLGKFKESLLKRKPLNLEEVNERAYNYIWIEEVEKRARKGRGNRPMEDTRRRSPEPMRRSAFAGSGHPT
ncbi:hypothetical protein LIER_19057 [Lithospermum erythrorhizon]|uniref:Uncharacterized protein n=1 Tax=Lithospermum erythrorhizon TaxID=34254 RepID=A0AAV3QG97_LITER